MELSQVRPSSFNVATLFRGSQFGLSEFEIVAANVIDVLARNGDTWRPLAMEEYKRHSALWPQSALQYASYLDEFVRLGYLVAGPDLQQYSVMPRLLALLDEFADLPGRTGAYLYHVMPGDFQRDDRFRDGFGERESESIAVAIVEICAAARAWLPFTAASLLGEKSSGAESLRPLNLDFRLAEFVNAGLLIQDVDRYAVTDKFIRTLKKFIF